MHKLLTLYYVFLLIIKAIFVFLLLIIVTPLLLVWFIFKQSRYKFIIRRELRKFGYDPTVIKELVKHTSLFSFQHLRSNLKRSN